MTKEITKAIILQEIQDKLKLRDLEPETFRFLESVVPVYDIEQHLRKATSRYTEVSITGTGGQLFCTVPADEKWFLNAYNVIFMGAGGFTVAGLYVTRDPNHSWFIYYDLTAGQSVSYAVDLPKVIELNPKDRISINIDGYTSTQSLRLYIDYAIEVVR